MTLKSAIAALVATTCLTCTASASELTRVVTVPLGAEITGMYMAAGDLFFNVQHPNSNLPNRFAKATVGVIANADFAAPSLSVADNDADKHVVRSSLGAYQVLIQQGDFGGKMGLISGEAGEIKQSNDPDFNAFLPTDTGKGYLFTNWEDRPGGMSRVMLNRSPEGIWTADESDAKMLDFSSVRGTWVNCFGTMSPWNTPLSSEELYFDNTADWNNASFKYAGGPNALEAYLGHFPNPYDYGYIVEITDPTNGANWVHSRHMCRFSHENAVVMPDRKTVYLSDDGTDVVFFKFDADTPGDMSAGTLFAARITQLGDAGADPASTPLQISWIELAHGTNEEITRWVRQYDNITRDAFEVGKTSYIPDTDIAIWARGEAADNRVAFLESRKAAKAKGATAEFRKMEGVNINAKGAMDGSVPYMYMYMAMSSIGKGMSDDKGRIQLSQNKCGVVYQMKLDANFNTSMMVPVVAGGAYDTSNAANACDVAAISNPDNIVVLDNGDVLIGEDTGKHENNAMWLWKASNS